MHFMILLMMLGMVCLIRQSWSPWAGNSWHLRWHYTLAAFVLPPLLLSTTAIAVVWMGPFGQMFGKKEGWLSYGLAIGLLSIAIFNWYQLVDKGHKMVQEVRSYPLTSLGDLQVRLLDWPTVYIAQIGFWEPELVVTQQLLTMLDSEHLAAVLAHEQAHYHFRDTFCFFWLGWVRQITTWLPKTEMIWQELLLLREIRADRWASQQTDPLLVAESLLLVVQKMAVCHEEWGVAFSQLAPVDRLNQRIDALLQTTESASESFYPWSWTWLLLALPPLLIIPFHN